MKTITRITPVATTEKYFFGSIGCKPIGVVTAITVTSITSKIAPLRSTSETISPRLKPIAVTRQASGVPASRLTMPAEMMVRKASSTDRSRSRTERSGTTVYQPVVGFGAVALWGYDPARGMQRRG